LFILLSITRVKLNKRDKIGKLYAKYISGASSCYTGKNFWPKR